MPNSYDAATKWLIDRHPEDWLKLLGLPAENAEPFDVETLDSDLATVTASADRVFRVHSPDARLTHIELETGHHGANTPFSLLRYSILLTGKYGLPVDSAVLLLKREADSPTLDGPLEYRRSDGSAYLVFQYNVVRVWEVPADFFLNGGLGTLPLAPIADIAPGQLPNVMRRLEERIENEAGSESGELWTATNVVMGLRYSQAMTRSLLKGMRQMRDSVTYQAIIDEGKALGEARGRVGEAQALLLRIARMRLGELRPGFEERVMSLTALEDIERIVDRVVATESWSELDLDRL